MGLGTSIDQSLAARIRLLAYSALSRKHTSNPRKAHSPHCSQCTHIVLDTNYYPHQTSPIASALRHVNFDLGTSYHEYLLLRLHILGPCLTQQHQDQNLAPSYTLAVNESIHSGFQTTSSLEEGRPILNQHASPDSSLGDQSPRCTTSNTRLRHKIHQRKTVQYKTAERSDHDISQRQIRRCLSRGVRIVQSGIASTRNEAQRSRI